MRKLLAGIAVALVTGCSTAAAPHTSAPSTPTSAAAQQAPPPAPSCTSQVNQWASTPDTGNDGITTNGADVQHLMFDAREYQTYANDKADGNGEAFLTILATNAGFLTQNTPFPACADTDQLYELIGGSPRQVWRPLYLRTAC